MRKQQKSSVLTGPDYKNIWATQENQVFTLGSGGFWDTVLTQAKVYQQDHQKNSVVQQSLKDEAALTVPSHLHGLNSQNRDKWAVESMLIYEVLQNASV